MTSRLLFRVVIAILVTGSATLALARDGNAPASKTGAPAIATKGAEGDCTDCHGDFALNIGGNVQIIGAPTYYNPGDVYTFSVKITSSQTAGSTNNIVWGFELTAVRMSTGEGAGTFTSIPSEGTSILNGTGQFASRQYVRVNSNNQTAVPSPVSWQVQWTAPAAGTGSVSFFASGVAGDGDGTNNGDWVYTTSTLAKDVTPIKSSSWGGVKQLYR